ncbi:MAG: hypothetical protein LBI45_06155, partial [Bacteroidales bacterium]|nr:hypothetical protein [Bacteroidales bacterium]
MKKFTIFLLTFLLFVGFNQLNAQEYGDDGGPQRAADLISPMFQSGLRCTNDASIVLRAVFTVTASTGSYNLLSSPLIYLSDDGITFDPPIIPDFATPDNAYFYSDITVMKGQTKYLYATIVEFMGGTSYVTLTSIVATLTVVDPPTVTISPDPLVGVMCEGGSVELNGKVAWTISEAEFTNITYSWLLDGAVKETGMYSNYNNPPPPHPIGDIKTYNFEDLAVGQREFTFGVVVTDSLGRYSVGRSCDVDTTISIIVVNQPEVTLEQPPLTPPICENADELTLIATNDAPFTQVLDDFNGVGIFDAVYSLYIDDSTTPFEEHTFSVLAGNAIPQYTFTVPVKGFLEPCEHTFKVTLAIINTDISANLDAFCLGEGELEIIIWQLPLITLNKDTVEVCSGEPIAIIATASNEECGSDEFWHPFNWIPLTIGGELGTVTPNPVPDDLLTTTTSTYNNMIEPSYHTTVSEFIYVTVVDGNGCVSLLDSALIIVHPLPELVAVFDEDVCLNDDPFLLGPGYPIDDMGVQIPVCATCIEVYAGPGVEAMTNDDDEIIGYIFDPAKAGVGIHEITYTFTDEFGCTNSETFDIEVRDLPEATFEYLGAPEEFCAVGTYLPTITIISNDAMLTNQRFDIIPDD